MVTVGQIEDAIAYPLAEAVLSVAEDESGRMLQAGMILAYTEALKRLYAVSEDFEPTQDWARAYLSRLDAWDIPDTLSVH